MWRRIGLVILAAAVVTLALAAVPASWAMTVFPDQLTFDADKSEGALFILNEELRIPVWGALRLAVFTDIGQVWTSWSDADFRLSVGAGVGVRWSTPIGPVWADVAWPVANVGISSKRTKFYLGIGRPF